MSFPPIVERELRVRARRGSTHLTRVAAVAVALVLAGMFYPWVFSMRAGSPGRALFTTLSIFAFLFCLLEGLRQTVDCVSEEKREGTLGLLFLTDLQGYDVVLGKLAACALNSIYALLGAAPILGITLMLGGVSGGQFARMVLVLLNTLFYALAIGIWASSLSRDHGNAWAAALGMLALFGVCIPAMGWFPLLIGNSAPHSGAGWVLLWLGRLGLGLSPLHGFIFELGTPIPRYFPGFWTCFLTSNAAAWFILRKASSKVRHSWQDEPAPALVPYSAAAAPPLPAADPSSPPVIRVEETAPQFAPWVDPSYAAEAEKVRKRFISRNPMMWLALRHGHSPGPVWVIVAIALLMLPAASADRQMLALFSGATVLVKLILRLWVALQAGRSFAEARKNGALELLLSTPMTPQDIIHGQWLALRHRFFWPAVVLACAGAVGTILLVKGARDLGPYVLALGWGGMFLLDLAALASFSMSLSLRLRKPTQAGILSFVFVFVLPHLLFCFPWLAAITDIIFIVRGKMTMVDELRRVAARL